MDDGGLECLGELKALQAMTPEERNALQWTDQCADCEQRIWELNEYWMMVHDDVWALACATDPMLKDGRGMLCVGCTERRLGRLLTPEDFSRRGGIPPLTDENST